MLFRMNRDRIRFRPRLSEEGIDKERNFLFWIRCNSPVTKSLFDQAASWAMMMTSIGVSPSMAEMTAIASAESV